MQKNNKLAAIFRLFLDSAMYNIYEIVSVYCLYTNENTLSESCAYIFTPQSQPQILLNTLNTYLK